MTHAPHINALVEHSRQSQQPCRHPAKLRRLVQAGEYTGEPRQGVLECQGCGAQREVMLFPPGPGNRYLDGELAEPVGPWKRKEAQ